LNDGQSQIDNCKSARQEEDGKIVRINISFLSVEHSIADGAIVEYPLFDSIDIERGDCSWQAR